MDLLEWNDLKTNLFPNVPSQLLPQQIKHFLPFQGIIRLSESLLSILPSFQLRRLQHIQRQLIQLGQ